MIWRYKAGISYFYYRKSDFESSDGGIGHKRARVAENKVGGKNKNSRRPWTPTEAPAWADQRSLY